MGGEVVPIPDDPGYLKFRIDYWYKSKAPVAKAMGGVVVPIPEVRDIKCLGNNPGAAVLTTDSLLLSPDLFCSPDRNRTCI